MPDKLDLSDFARKCLAILRGDHDGDCDLGPGVEVSLWARIDARLRRLRVVAMYLGSEPIAAREAARAILGPLVDAANRADEDWVTRELIASWKREITLWQMLSETTWGQQDDETAAGVGTRGRGRRVRRDRRPGGRRVADACLDAGQQVCFAQRRSR